MKGKFKASPEQAKEFSEKMIASMYEKFEPHVNKETGEIKSPPLDKQTGEPITNPFKLAKISNAANKECKEFMSNLWKETRKQNQQYEQKQEQTQSRGRGM
jgi:polyhydroxyalkanoate synthesis regulator phasin